MELSKKTTILLTPTLYDRLTAEAKRRSISMGEVVREACELRYGFGASDVRLHAVEDIEALSLPVASPRQMKRESVVDPGALLP